jgi:flavin-dependent dehydrogenase
VVECDALIVGGGPAGSTCAWALRRAGWNVVVIDRAAFPRDKVCAGWLTPPVFDLLELDPSDLRDARLTLQPITGFVTSVLGAPPVETHYGDVVSYAIRRCEFDDFLLRRAGVRVLDGTPLSTLRRTGGAWIANGHVRSPIVIGAGGHFCPVARHLRRDAAIPQPVVAKEAEYRLDAVDARVVGERPELFFCRDLEGYGWCVRKGDYVNVGIGRRDKANFSAHVDAFAAFLERTGKAPGATRARWRGHAYLASGVGTPPVVGDGVALVGDAAGLAYPESGEGIKPAIESALLAARTLIDAAGRHGADDLRPYEAQLRRRHPEVTPRRGPLTRAITAAGRALLRSRTFTRHVMLDRWFLRR